GCVVDHLTEGTLLRLRRRHVVGRHFDVVVHGLDAVDTERDLFGEVLVDAVGDIAGQRCLAFAHHNLEVIGAQAGAQRESGPDLRFLARLDYFLGGSGGGDDGVRAGNGDGRDGP